MTDAQTVLTHHYLTQIRNVLHVSGHASSALTIKHVHHVAHLTLSINQPVFQAVVRQTLWTIKTNVKHVHKSAKAATSQVAFNAQIVLNTYLVRIVYWVVLLCTKMTNRWHVKAVETHARLVLPTAPHVVVALTNTHLWLWKTLAIKYAHQNTFPKTVIANYVHKETPFVTNVHSKIIVSPVHHVWKINFS